MTYADVPCFAESFSYTPISQVASHWQANTTRAASISAPRDSSPPTSTIRWAT